MHLMVVGGAGYIGSNFTAAALEAGHQVTVLDNLVKGHRAAVLQGAQFVEGDIADRALVRHVLSEERFDAVLHFAAYSLVGESVGEPAKYYENNVVATLGLLQEMRAAGVMRFIFSSTAATFGEPSEMPITEETVTAPINPYGRTKLVVEWMLRDFEEAYGLHSVSLRYFNAAGVSHGCGEDHQPETHLIPNILAVPLGQREAIDVFGTDYPTPDGTAVRDYIHVADLADAHLRALALTEAGSDFFVLGSGTGYSVKEVIEAARRVTGHSIPVCEKPRRAGDPPALVASGAKAQRVFGWTPRRGIEEIVSSAWEWHQAHPDGYKP